MLPCRRAQRVCSETLSPSAGLRHGGGPPRRRTAHDRRFWRHASVTRASWRRCTNTCGCAGPDCSWTWTPVVPSMTVSSVLPALRATTGVPPARFDGGDAEVPICGCRRARRAERGAGPRRSRVRGTGTCFDRNCPVEPLPVAARTPARPAARHDQRRTSASWRRDARSTRLYGSTAPGALAGTRAASVPR